MMTKESLIEWASHWVPDEPPGQRQRFVDGLAGELKNWTPVTPEPVPPANTSLGVFDGASSLDVFGGR